MRKLFHKRAFNYAENKFLAQNKTKGKASRNRSHFYHHHFDKISQIKKFDLKTFYNPDKKTRPGLLKGLKTFNKAYVSLLLSSKSYKAVVK